MVRTAVADTMSAQSCVTCHNSDPNSPKKDWKLGDVRGVLEVASVIDDQLADGVSVSHMIVICALIAGLILSALTYWVIHNVTRPLGKLVSAMQSLAAGDFDVVLPGLTARTRSAHGRRVERSRSRRSRRPSRARRRGGQRAAAAAARNAEMCRLANSFEPPSAT